MHTFFRAKYNKRVLLESFVKVIVCVKQVPDTSDIQWTEHNTIKREGVESVINPFDTYALETALRLKDKYNAHISVISMGPPQAGEMLKEALAMGADDAVLVSDRKFSGADTIATSRTIGSAISKGFKDFDLIICGQFAVDGDTGQTGPSIAQFLNIPQITYVKEIIDYNDNSVTVKKESEDGIETIKIKLPALLCVEKCDFEPRNIKIKGYIETQNSEIKVLSLEDLEIEAESVGMKGSPTYVSKAFRPEGRKKGEIITPQTKEEGVNYVAEKINAFLENKGL